MAGVWAAATIACDFKRSSGFTAGRWTGVPLSRGGVQIRTLARYHAILVTSQ